MHIQQLVRVFLMILVVLAENKRNKTSVVIYDRKCIQLIIPDNVIGLFQRCAFFRIDHLFDRCHKAFHLIRRIHTADPVITAGNDTYQLAVDRTVIGDSNR